MKNKFKNMKGITLITLVITIIVLLILAGVTVATLTGENGLLSKAQLAKERTAEGEQDEKDKLSSYENELNNYGTWERTGGNNTVTISQDEYDMLKNANSYSTTGKRIGTWTNNKPLYQKVINVTSPANDSDWHVVHTETGADYVRVVYGEMFYSVANANYLLNYMTSEVISCTSDSIRLSTNSTWAANCPVMLVIQYTLADDLPVTQ